MIDFLDQVEGFIMMEALGKYDLEIKKMTYGEKYVYHLKLTMPNDALMLKLEALSMPNNQLKLKVWFNKEEDEMLIDTVEELGYRIKQIGDVEVFYELIIETTEERLNEFFKGYTEVKNFI